MTWSYRILRHEEGLDCWYTIHEVYSDRDGNIVKWTVNPSAPFGEDVNELLSDIETMKEAFKKTILARLCPLAVRHIAAVVRQAENRAWETFCTSVFDPDVQ